MAISLPQARRINLEPNEEEMTEDLPEYNQDAPRPPSYENCTRTSPNSLLWEDLGSECRMSTPQAGMRMLGAASLASLGADEIDTDLEGLLHMVEVTDHC